MPRPFLVAIVDDDRAVREALCDLLQVEGLSARGFGNAAAFLAEEGISDFDCLITDVRMPEIDGLELQRRLRAQGSALPVIFITSYDDAGTRRRAFEGAATAFFAKPVDDEALLRTLRALLDGGPNEPSGY